MFKHEEIWIAIDRLANNAGYSTSGLAKKAGLDPTAFNRSKRMSPEGKPRWPSTESLAKILTVTNVSMNEFITLIHINHALSASPTEKQNNVIPVLHYQASIDDNYFDADGFPKGNNWDYVEIPAFSSKDEAIYAIEINDDTMEPLYREGDFIIVAPHFGIRRGDRIVVKTNDGQLLIKQLVRKTASKIELKSLNDHYTNLTIELDDISWLSRILWVTQ